MYKSSKKVDEYGGWINGWRTIEDMFPGNNGTSGGLIGCKKTVAEAKKRWEVFEDVAVHKGVRRLHWVFFCVFS